MTHATTILVHFILPRPFTDGFASPTAIKQHLMSLGIWPAHVEAERWREATVSPGYEVDLEVAVPVVSLGAQS